eukprot:scaffold22148_cov99-Amphora_coffeaeformis.AAC.1
MSSASPFSNSFRVPVLPLGGAFSGGSVPDSLVTRRRKRNETTPEMEGGLVRPRRLDTDRREEGLLVQRRPGETPEEFTKRRNLCYGKRMAERWHREMTGLEHEHHNMKIRNETLRRDNRRLEAALVQARFLVSLHHANTTPPPPPPAMLKE